MDAKHKAEIERLMRELLAEVEQLRHVIFALAFTAESIHDPHCTPAMYPALLETIERHAKEALLK